MAGSAGRDEFNYTPKEHYWSKSSFTFFGRRRDTMWGPSSTAAHVAAHRGPVFYRFGWVITWAMEVCPSMPTLLDMFFQSVTLPQFFCRGECRCRARSAVACPWAGPSGCSSCRRPDVPCQRPPHQSPSRCLGHNGFPCK